MSHVKYKIISSIKVEHNSEKHCLQTISPVDVIFYRPYLHINRGAKKIAEDDSRVIKCYARRK